VAPVACGEFALEAFRASPCSVAEEDGHCEGHGDGCYWGQKNREHGHVKVQMMGE